MAQQYDVTLKMLLQDSDGQAVHLATGLSVAAWLNIELPKIANPRVDLLGQTDDGSLLHLELQVGNDAEMPMRMAEYALAIYRSLGKFARQIVLYAGEPELRMETTLQGPGFSFRYEVIDLRDVDGDTLLASDNLGDNVLAIVTRCATSRPRLKRSSVRSRRGMKPGGSRQSNSSSFLRGCAGWKKPWRRRF
jgi:hypothetical protein